MPDLEKVIKGLSICVPETQDDSKLECGDCPYEDVCSPSDIVGITLPLIWDIRDLLKEQEEKLKFLDALYNYINPNDMEKYMQMYKSLPISSDGRSVK